MRNYPTGNRNKIEKTAITLLAISLVFSLFPIGTSGAQCNKKVCILPQASITDYESEAIDSTQQIDNEPSLTKTGNSKELQDPDFQGDKDRKEEKELQTLKTRFEREQNGKKPTMKMWKKGFSIYLAKIGSALR